jgi:hypothetical protein
LFLQPKSRLTHLNYANAHRTVTVGNARPPVKEFPGPRKWSRMTVPQFRPELEYSSVARVVNIMENDQAARADDRRVQFII